MHPHISTIEVCKSVGWSVTLSLNSMKIDLFQQIKTRVKSHAIMRTHRWSTMLPHGSLQFVCIWEMGAPSTNYQPGGNWSITISHQETRGTKNRQSLLWRCCFTATTEHIFTQKCIKKTRYLRN